MNRTAVVMLLMLFVIVVLGMILGRNAQVLLLMDQRIKNQSNRISELEKSVKALQQKKISDDEKKQK